MPETILRAPAAFPLCHKARNLSSNFLTHKFCSTHNPLFQEAGREAAYGSVKQKVGKRKNSKSRENYNVINNINHPKLLKKYLLGFRHYANWRTSIISFNTATIMKSNPLLTLWVTCSSSASPASILKFLPGAVQQLRLCFHCRGAGLIPGQKTKVSIPGGRTKIFRELRSHMFHSMAK